MGGFGSGEWTRWRKKPLCEECPAVDIREVARRRLVSLERVGRLSFSCGDSSITVSLTWTSCTYGGRRPWFLCPRCSRRVAKVYLHRGRWGCRECFDLAYQTQREDALGRVYAKEHRIFRKLDERDPRGQLLPLPERPKGMHWRTYFRLVQEAGEAQGMARLGLAEKIGKMSRDLEILEKVDEIKRELGERRDQALIGLPTAIPISHSLLSHIATHYHSFRYIPDVT